MLLPKSPWKTTSQLKRRSRLVRDCSEEAIPSQRPATTLHLGCPHTAPTTGEQRKLCSAAQAQHAVVQTQPPLPPNTLSPTSLTYKHPCGAAKDSKTAPQPQLSGVQGFLSNSINTYYLLAFQLTAYFVLKFASTVSAKHFSKNCVPLLLVRASQIDRVPLSTIGTQQPWGNSGLNGYIVRCYEIG